ncbi:hypothetical protein [Herbaspirillum sp.]|jgi:hypothetical protein|uniref:DUF7448 domain-containing protein n=1 Tax=Herbaspirillum sp. TaxID=1890675 RepID=UPI000C0A5E47|nr:hypothetical protein [Herbaspirillum sp.]MAF06142.1 hypothetical protein [Herbaspirillum sp.]|tara:strand:+ start:8205 stop:8576 length:372 start_codon:yes stop_codon:yes gene_type:complete
MNELQWRTIEELKGFTLNKVENVDNGEELHFHRDDGKKVIMYHDQDCCESVTLEDIDGELDYLVGSPILEAEEAWRDASDQAGLGDSETWTYYKLGTAKGSVSLRWVGSSNGYYSESVDIRVE